MAQKLKFGNGKWATKKGSTLAYNDENNNFKPLPFTTTRNSIATRVNKEGLIEVVGNDIPRIDYKDSTDGALLLENSAENKVTYSEDFTQWTDYNASAVLSEETIYGKNAYKIVEDNTTNYHGVYLSNLFTANGTNYIWSAYVKGAERRYVVLTGRTGISSNDSALIFDTQDGVWVLDSSSQNQALSAESVGNGWWRISMEGDPTSGAYDSFTIASSLGGTTYTDANYQGDGTSGIYVAMPQLEAGSYPSSYIPTNGSTVQRSAETCNGSGNSEVFNSQEGVLFLDTKALSNDGTTRTIGLSDGSNSNRIHFINYAVANGYSVNYRVSNSTQVAFTEIGNVLDYQKIAFKYKSGDFSLWYNGFEIDTDSNTNMMADGVLNTLSFRQEPNSFPFFGKTKELGYYDEILTDLELEYMTSYRSLNEMVTELNLNAL